MRLSLHKNGVELRFEGKEAEAALKSFIILNSQTPLEAISVLELIEKLIRCQASEVTARTRRFRIRVVRGA